MAGVHRQGSALTPSIASGSDRRNMLLTITIIIWITIGGYLVSIIYPRKNTRLLPFNSKNLAVDQGRDEGLPELDQADGRASGELGDDRRQARTDPVRRPRLSRSLARRHWLRKADREGG